MLIQNFKNGPNIRELYGKRFCHQLNANILGKEKKTLLQLFLWGRREGVSPSQSVVNAMIKRNIRLAFCFVTAFLKDPRLNVVLSLLLVSLVLSRISNGLGKGKTTLNCICLSYFCLIATTTINGLRRRISLMLFNALLRNFNGLSSAF